MAREQGEEWFIPLLIASGVTATAALSLSVLLLQGFSRAALDYRRAVILTLPYAVIWGVIGAGAAFILGRRIPRRRLTSWVMVGTAGGTGLAALSTAVLGSPAGRGLFAIVGVILAGASWGGLLGWFAWIASGETTKSMDADSR